MAYSSNPSYPTPRRHSSGINPTPRRESLNALPTSTAIDPRLQEQPHHTLGPWPLSRNVSSSSGSNSSTLRSRAGSLPSSPKRLNRSPDSTPTLVEEQTLQVEDMASALTQEPFPTIRDKSDSERALVREIFSIQKAMEDEETHTSYTIPVIARVCDENRLTMRLSIPDDILHSLEHLRHGDHVKLDVTAHIRQILDEETARAWSELATVNSDDIPTYTLQQYRQIPFAKAVLNEIIYNIVSALIWAPIISFACLAYTSEKPCFEISLNELAAFFVTLVLSVFFSLLWRLHPAFDSLNGRTRS